MSSDYWKVGDFIPEGQSGNAVVQRFVVSETDEEFGRLRALCGGGGGRFTPAGYYTSLFVGGTLMMSDVPDEYRDHSFMVFKASGNCLINGLGLGCVLRCILEKRNEVGGYLVNKATVIENNPDVIQLVAPHFQKVYGDRVEIIQADAFTFKPPKGVRYDVVWHDIWPVLNIDNLSEMKTLHRRYGRVCDWQGSWGKEYLQDRRSRGGY